MKNKIEKVQKRDGSIVPFDQRRIEEAIFKALTASGEGNGKRAKRLSNKVVQILNRRFKKGEIPHVEQIQDIVEEVLILEGLVKTAKAYILYREQRRRIREAIKVSEEAVDRLDQYLEKLDWEVQENANMAFSLQGLNHYGVSYIIKKYWLNKIYPPEIREAHDSGDFHIHNLDTLGPYCVGWDLYDLLIKGFGGVPGKVESKPAKHFRAALGQVVNFMYTLQGEAAGAISFSNFDTLLAPFIRYDNLNYQQVKQALQEFLFNMAIPTRVGFQCPFTNITLDLKPSPVYAKLPVIIGGKPQDKTYSEFEEEMKIFDKALYEVYMEGDAKGRPFHFPIPTINITKDFPWEDPAFDGIFEASAKYGTNYFANYINSEMKPEDVRSMCIEANEEILIRNSKKIKRLSIKEVTESYKDGDFDEEGWAECKKEGNLEVLSLNPQTLKLEWVPVKRFLKIKDNKAVEVITEDGKKAIFSLKHPMAIYTSNGIQMKFAKDVKIGEKILVTDLLQHLQKIGNSENKLKLQKVQPVSIKEIKIRRYKKLKEFYDIELERNHLFVHSLGQISFNCCRLRLDLTELYNRGGGGLFGAGNKTGSIGVVTINLPRIGYLSKTKKEFFERLAKIMDLAKESLEIKRKVIENFIEKGLYPYSRYYLQDIKKMRGKYWTNHFSTIGLVGMNECLLNFMGENIASKRGRKFALEVLDFMRERLVKYQEETGNIYNLEATPAESTAFRLALKDKEKYPDIITAGTKKVPYYTNSSMLPVNFTDDLFEALKLQDEIQCKYTGGVVFHIFLGERMQNGEGVKRLVKKVFENFKLPYITITPTFSICPVHGYIPGEHFFCPKCTIKQPCEVYSRIVGYYRPVQQWNLGKQQEFKQRKEFKIPKEK
jgi:ribonucleoside-triphosphate reductase